MSVIGSRPGWYLLVLGLLTTALFASAAVAGSGPGTVIHEGRYDAGAFTWQTDPEGKRFLGAEDLGMLSEPGQPLLPAADLLLLVPAGRQVAEAWIEPISTRLEKGTPLPALADPHVTDTGEIHDVRRLQAVDGVFPASWGEYGGVHAWRGYELLGMKIYPVRSIQGADGHSLEFLEEYAVRVRYDDGSTERHTLQRERFIPGERETNESVLRSIVSNPTTISSYPRTQGVVVAEDGGAFNPSRTPSLTGSAVQYLIITTEAMEAEFQVLADYKTSLGIPTLVATREFIEANYRNGADIQETIRMFLQDAYAKWGTEYVLLGGDTDVLPARYVSNTFYPSSGHTDIPVDLYFACLDGNWNGNGNSLYCEADATDFVGDDADFAEEIFLGRATVSSPEAAAVFVGKVMQYETAAQGSGWPNRILYAAEVLFPAEYSEGQAITLDGAQFSHQMVEELVEPCTEMEYVRMYETNAQNPWDAPLTREALIDSLNTGHFGIFNQIGHGFYFNMSVGDANFMNTDADNLTNENYFVLFSLNCASAAFDYSCLMERFLQNPNGGSIVSIGSSRAAFPNNSNNYQQGFFDALLCTDEIRVGKLIALSRLPYLANTEYNYVDRWTFQNYSLLGDPTLPLWSGVPDGLSVAAGNLALGQNQLTVTVTDAMALPVADAVVCLSRSGEDYAQGMTDANGQVTLDYTASGPGDVTLKVTGKNLAQDTTNVAVVGGSSYFEYDSAAILDGGAAGTSGNFNGKMETGETIGLLPTLTETVGAGVSGLTGVLSTATSGVTVTSGPLSFGDISGGGSIAPMEPFLVALDANMGDSSPIEFRLDLTDGSANTYIVEWTAMALQPEAEMVLVDWEDTTYGNGDGILDSNERIVVHVRVKNYGAGTLDQMDIELQTHSTNVVLYETTGSTTDIDPMETSGDVTGFSMALVTANRRSESFFVLTDNYGRTSQHDFYPQRPVAPIEITTDTSLGADIIALSWPPVEDEDVHGYNIYRSQSPAGPFLRVNQDIVVGTSYYRDEGLGQLTKYYYQVESLAYPLVPSTMSEMVAQATAPAELEGFPVQFPNETSSHLAVGDVDGDTDLETVLVSDEVYIWHHDGTELFDGDSDSQTLGVFTDLDATISPAGVALAQLDGQPGWEIIISVIEPSPALYIYRHDGTILEGWPQSLNFGSGTKWNWATPAVGDIDGDNDFEIVVNTLNGQTFAFHHDGTEVIDGDADPSTDGVFLQRPGATWEWILSSPALADLDGDGDREILFGTDSDGLGGSRLEARQGDGSIVSGFPYYTNGRINSSPAVADLNNDGVMEIAFYDLFRWLYVVQEDGSDYPGFPVQFDFGNMSAAAPSVALGDMDEDGQLEVIFAGNINGNTSRLVVVDTDVSGGTSGDVLDGWPLTLPGSSEGSPVIGDLDGDEVPDILYGIGGGSEDAPNNLYALRADGSSLDGFPITLGGPLMASPVITDLDQDQDVDIVLGAWDRVVHVWDMPFAYDVAHCPWPTFHGNMRRDGIYLHPNLVLVEDGQDLPAAAFAMGAPYPNPFNPSTSVRLHVPSVDGSGSLELVVYNLQGRKVRTLFTGAIAPGWHTMVWDGRDDSGRGQSSGMYFLRARSGSHSSIHKMTLVK